MKKKTMKIAMVAVVAAVAGYVTYQNQAKEIGMSELALANVEALAFGESGSFGCGRAVYEWDNPYFGFPEMIRFAFHPNKSAREKIAQLKAEGKTTAFSELFGTYSNEEDAPDYDVFKKPAPFAYRTFDQQFAADA